MENNFIESKSKRYYPNDNNTIDLLKKNSVIDFLNWSNLLVNLTDREIAVNLINQYVCDLKKLNCIDKGEYYE